MHENHFFFSVRGTRKCKDTGNKPGGHDTSEGCSYCMAEGPCVHRVCVCVSDPSRTFIQVLVTLILPVQPSDWSSRFTCGRL